MIVKKQKKNDLISIFTRIFLLLIIVKGVFALNCGALENKSVDLKALQEEIKKKLENIQERITQSKESENEETVQRLGIPLARIRERTDKLKEIEAYYNRQFTALKKQAALEQDIDNLNKKLKSANIIDVPQQPPFSLSYYDEYVTLLTENLRNKRTAELALKLYTRSLEEDKLRLKEASQKVRILKEDYEGKQDSEENVQMAWKVELAEIEEELAKAMLKYQEIIFNNAQKEVELAKMKVEINQKNVNWIRRHLHYDEADLQKQVDALEKRKEGLQAEIDKLITEQQYAEMACIDAQKRLEKAKSNDEKARAQAALTANEQWRKTYQKKVEHHEATIHLINQQQQLWKERYELLKKDLGYEKVSSWRSKSKENIEELTRNINFQQELQANLQLDIAKLEGDLNNPNIDEAVKAHLQEQRKAYREMSNENFIYLSTLNTTNQLYLRFIDELSREQKGVAFWDKFLAVMSKIYSVWTFELIVIDNRSVTVGKAIIAFLIATIGLFVAKRLTQVIHVRILSRVRFKESTAAITEKLLYYITVLFVVLLALRVVNIPLTAFAFLGGAVAIGVGFGAQKLMNNFISGFILMAEQPVKVGDLIEMNGSVGVIEDIGVRSTRVRIMQSMHILVPNSYFLENNIINWTHFDNKVRCQLKVGVVYGSPVEEVKQLLLKASKEHETVLKYPEPFVFFEDFGDDSLIFDLYFWIVMRRVIDRRKVESDLRFRIDELFRQANIVIAFPQRDVHLDTTKPLQLEMIKSQSILSSTGHPEKQIWPE
jgi:potassium efflux system protein